MVHRCNTTGLFTSLCAGVLPVYLLLVALAGSAAGEAGRGH